jgi:hypothetical protein
MESRNPDTRDEGSGPVARIRSSPSAIARASAELVHPGKTLIHRLREDAVPIVDDEAVGRIARPSFPELLQRPFRRGMAGDIVVENPPRSISMMRKTERVRKAR